MPTISIFLGIYIQMFWREHAPPHFHAKYGEFEIAIAIKDFQIVEGYLPSKALALVIEWAAIHQKELLENWALGQSGKSFNKIEPLV